MRSCSGFLVAVPLAPKAVVSPGRNGKRTLSSGTIPVIVGLAVIWSAVAAVPGSQTAHLALSRTLDANGESQVPPIFIYQLGQSRWSIDVEVFQTITTDSHLKHLCVHQGHARALVMLSMIRLLAYTLTMVFYHRQVCSHFPRRPFGFCDLALKAEVDSGEVLEGVSSRQRSRVMPWLTAAVVMILALAFAVTLTYILRTTAETVSRLTNPMQVTAALGVENYPTWSPEGQRLTYQSNQSGNDDIWVAQLGGGSP